MKVYLAINLVPFSDPGYRERQARAVRYLQKHAPDWVEVIYTTMIADDEEATSTLLEELGINSVIALGLDSQMVPGLEHEPPRPFVYNLMECGCASWYEDLQDDDYIGFINNDILLKPSFWDFVVECAARNVESITMPVVDIHDDQDLDFHLGVPRPNPKSIDGWLVQRAVWPAIAKVLEPYIIGVPFWDPAALDIVEHLDLKSEKAPSFTTFHVLHKSTWHGERGPIERHELYEALKPSGRFCWFLYTLRQVGRHLRRGPHSWDDLTEDEAKKLEEEWSDIRQKLFPLGRYAL